MHQQLYISISSGLLTDLVLKCMSYIIIIITLWNAILFYSNFLGPSDIKMIIGVSEVSCTAGIHICSDQKLYLWMVYCFPLIPFSKTTCTLLVLYTKNVGHLINTILYYFYRTQSICGVLSEMFTKAFPCSKIFPGSKLAKYKTCFFKSITFLLINWFLYIKMDKPLIVGPFIWTKIFPICISTCINIVLINGYLANGYFFSYIFINFLFIIGFGFFMSLAWCYKGLPHIKS